MGDVLFVLGFLALLIGPWILYKMYLWAWTLGIIGVVLGIGEGISALMTGKTLSQTFWAFSQQNPLGAIVISASLIIAWMMLLLHLLWKVI